MKSFLSIVLALVFTLAASAQATYIRGSVIDGSTGESIIGAAVKIEGTTVAGMTDLDGNFSLKAAPGTYTVSVAYFTFKTKKIAGVAVKPGDATVLGTIVLESEDDVKLEEVVITAEATRNSEASLLTLKKKSTVIMDGISAAKIGLTGDATAVEAAKRVTGVSIEGGKYIFVRGLGDRYSKTTLNGMDIPGLDPDRNTIQMDIFPTDLISNIVVSKAFTADMPADFTGGLLNVETKAFPERKIFNVNMSGGYTPSMHFRNDYLTYKGSATDFLGFDGGTRRLPAGADASVIPTPISGLGSQATNDFVNSFNKTLGASEAFVPMDFSLGLSMGNQWDAKKANKQGEIPKLGYIFSATYKSSFNNYRDVFYGEYQRFADPSLNELRYATTQEGALGEQNVLVGLLGGFAKKTGTRKFRMTLMHLQNGEKRAGQFLVLNDGAAVGQSGYIARSNNLEYNQRSLTNLLVNGTRVWNDANEELDWRFAPTLSLSSDPDIRRTAYTFDPVTTAFSAGAGGNPSRIWRSLAEVNLPLRVDYTKKFLFNRAPGKLQYGASNTFKFRDYEILFYDMQFFGLQPRWEAPYDPNVVLDPSNIYGNGQGGTIYYQSGNRTPNPNKYQSNSNTAAAYVSTELAFSVRLKAVLGLRAEHFIQRHTGRDQAYASGDVINGRNLDNDVVLNSLDLFPSANLIYSVNENTNLRLVATRTIARPSFKELSFAQILDPLTNRIFNGSFFPYSSWDGNLVETRITNADLRWERFFKDGQVFSVSGFYKQFQNPIELVRIAEQQTSTEFQPRNVGTGTMLGAEIEWNKNFAFISPKLRPLSFNGNITLIQSQITMTTQEFNDRKAFERTGEIIVNTRQMAGQSPYVLNGGFMYTAEQNSFGVFYNVKGPTLQIVGLGLFPDVYTMPFHSLNASFNRTVGKDDRGSLKFRVSNLMNDDVLSVYKSYQAEDQVFSRLVPGVSFSVGYSYKL